MKVFVSADIEGCTGLTSFSQCGAANAAHPDFGFARRMMTEDLNALIRGLRYGGAHSIVVKDGHGNCKNLLIDALEPGCELISGQGSARDGMMDGIDSSFDAAVLFGYHAMAGALDGVMEHALVGGLHRFWINNQPAGEILTNSAVAGHYGVPTILVTTDRVGEIEAQQAIPGAAIVCTKLGLGKYSAKVAGPSETHGEIQNSAKHAVESAVKIAPVRIPGPVTMRAGFRTGEEAGLASLLTGTVRVDQYTVQWTRSDLLTAHRVALEVFRLSIQGRKSGD